MIFVSDIAWKKIFEKLGKTGHKNLRIALSNKGCGGASYVFEPTNEDPTEEDYAIQNASYKIIVTGSVSQLVNNGTLDWVVKDSFNQGFDIVDNQSELGRCGCGQSIILK